jgi:hypothetical protein
MNYHITFQVPLVSAHRCRRPGPPTAIEIVINLNLGMPARPVGRARDRRAAVVDALRKVGTWPTGNGSAAISSAAERTTDEFGCGGDAKY